MTRLASVGLVILLACGGAARAEDCANASTQAAMDVCAGAAARDSEAALRAVYGQLVGRLRGDEDTRRLLAAAEKAWTRFRDAECVFSTNASLGGSIHPMLVAICRDQMAKDRTRRLRTYLKCQDGDMSCSAPRQ